MNKPNLFTVPDPVDKKHFPSLHAFLKTQSDLPWADKLDKIASLVIKDIDDKENAEALEAYRESKRD
jgi:hypothetical protein